MIEFECKRCHWIRREPWELGDDIAHHDGICQTCKASAALEGLHRQVIENNHQFSAQILGLREERDRLREERDSQQRVCIAEMEKVNQLRTRIAKFEQFVEWVKHAPVSSGVCCCGDGMKNHASPLTCGHEPVDEWDHALHGWLKELGLSK